MPSTAAVLGPTKPSDLVQLAAGGPAAIACPAPNAITAQLQRQLPDGTFVPLVIPPKKVLIITDGFFLVNNTRARTTSSRSS